MYEFITEKSKTSSSNSENLSTTETSESKSKDDNSLEIEDILQSINDVDLHVVIALNVVANYLNERYTEDTGQDVKIKTNLFSTNKLLYVRHQEPLLSQLFKKESDEIVKQWNSFFNLSTTEVNKDLAKKMESLSALKELKRPKITELFSELYEKIAKETNIDPFNPNSLNFQELIANRQQHNINYGSAARNALITGVISIILFGGSIAGAVLFFDTLEKLKDHKSNLENQVPLFAILFVASPIVLIALVVGTFFTPDGRKLVIQPLQEMFDHLKENRESSDFIESVEELKNQTFTFFGSNNKEQNEISLIIEEVEEVEEGKSLLAGK